MAPDRLAALTDELATTHHVPGLATAVVHDGRVSTGTSGTTSATDPLPVDEDTLFCIGSTTKTLTGTALMAHVEARALSLDDRLAEVLPELVLADPEAREAVTVGMLLDHTAGWRGDAVVDTGWGDDALARAVAEALPQEPQVTRPGEVVSYNNSALLVAGRLLEVVSGREFSVAVHDAVLAPLGMTSTFFLPWQATGRRFAVGHLVTGATATPVPGWPLTRATGPGGGAVSSLRDQLRWARWCLDGTTEGSAPLKDETRLLMQQPRAGARSSITGVGVTWLLQQRGDLRLVTHGGNVSNLQLGTFVLAPDHGLAVLALSNSRGGADAGRDLVDRVLAEDLGWSSPPPLPAAADPGDLLGRYDAGTWQIELARDAAGRLTAQRLLPEGTPEVVRQLFDAPPAEVVPVGGDLLALASRPWEPAGDLGRDADGQVAWLRWGMRVHPLVPGSRP